MIFNPATADPKAAAVAAKIEKNARDLIDPLRSMFRISG